MLVAFPFVFFYFLIYFNEINLDVLLQALLETFPRVSDSMPDELLLVVPDGVDGL